MDEYRGPSIPKMGFGGLFSVRNKSLSIDEAKLMVDEFMNAGLTCFDCAYAYDGEEEMLAEALVKRYPRESYQITEKITAWKLKEAGDARKCLESSRATLGIDYFDFLMLHNVSTIGQRAKIYEDLGVWEFMQEEKAAGRVGQIGFSFHDNAEVLGEVLERHPEVDFVMLPVSYLDWDDSIIQARRNYEVVRAHGKPIMIMKPLNGGLLVNLPPKAAHILEEAGVNPLELAYRFCLSLDGLIAMFTTMENLDQTRQNIAAFKNAGQLTPQDQALIDRIVAETRSADLIACTNCRYCMATCPCDVKIPWIFTYMNELKVYENYANSKKYYVLNTREGGKASDCIRCGKCVDQCPQMLPVMDLLEQAVEIFETSQQA